MKNKLEIKGRDEIFMFVKEFYSRIKKDDNLGPIFNRMLSSEEMWSEHLERLTDFWESNLFGVIKFKGNPIAAHQKTDKSHDNSITQVHFHEWLKIWNLTIDDLFIGEKAELAKEKARRMSTHLYVDMWKNKPENK